jgi:ABC-type Zn uptake system ZnuABC Zn-binding protein ZnuA
MILLNTAMLFITNGSQNERQEQHVRKKTKKNKHVMFEWSANHSMIGIYIQ